MVADDVNKFLSYFEKQWISHYRNWFEGASLGSPSTNNCLEATNAIIKKQYTLRERLRLGEFSDCLEQGIVANFSTERDTGRVNHKKIEDEPPISLQMWTKSYQWVKSNVSVLQDNASDDCGIYFIPSSKLVLAGKEFTDEFVSSLLSSAQNCVSFDEYRQTRESMWTVNLSKSSWRTGNCNCPVFLKQGVYKHLIGMAIRLGVAKPPDEAKNIPLEQKRKRGRPSKAKPALVMQ
jgi:hypothetical protein